MMMIQLQVLLTLIALVIPMNHLFGDESNAPQTVSFPASDGGEIFALLYGKGEKAVVLAHGGRFNKESWTKQAQQLATAGYTVLAIDFRGYGKSRGPGDKDPMSAPLHLDVLAAINYLQKNGAKKISLIGGSMGASAVADASIQTKPGDVDCVVLLAGLGNESPEKLRGRKLFVVARDDTRGDGVVRLVKIQEHFDKAAEPKKLIILEGDAHAQYLFETEQGERLMDEIVKFLSAS